MKLKSWINHNQVFKINKIHFNYKYKTLFLINIQIKVISNFYLQNNRKMINNMISKMIIKIINKTINKIYHTKNKQINNSKINNMINMNRTFHNKIFHNKMILN